MKRVRSWWRRRFDPDPPWRPYGFGITLRMAFGMPADEAEQWGREAAADYRQRWLEGDRNFPRKLYRPRLDAWRRVFVLVITAMAATAVLFTLWLVRLPGWEP